MGPFWKTVTLAQDPFLKYPCSQGYGLISCTFLECLRGRKEVLRKEKKNAINDIGVKVPNEFP